MPADMPGASRICTRNSDPETGIFSAEGQGADSGKISAGALARDETWDERPANSSGSEVSGARYDALWADRMGERRAGGASIVALFGE